MMVRMLGVGDVGLLERMGRLMREQEVEMLEKVGQLEGAGREEYAMVLK